MAGWAAVLAVVWMSLTLPAQPDDPGDIEPLDGPPFVTAKAWVIADAKTGQRLWGARDDEPSKAASTAKIMTAYVVLSYAAERPEVLQEQVSFSKQEIGRAHV